MTLRCSRGTQGEKPSVADLRWTRYAIENAFDVVNMSLSTTKREFAEGLHEPPT